MKGNSTSEVRELPSGMLIRRVDGHPDQCSLVHRAVDLPVCLDIEIQLTKEEFDALWPLSTREEKE